MRHINKNKFLFPYLFLCVFLFLSCFIKAKKKNILILFMTRDSSFFSCMCFFFFLIIDGIHMAFWGNSFYETLMVFSFLPKNVNFISKNLIWCLFLKNVSPSKRVICFILNNLHFPMVEGIAFYALDKSRVVIILGKADGFCLFIGLPDEI